MAAHREAPQQGVLDLDVADTPLHGHQEGRFFHGFYDEYCYLPLYIFCGDQILAVRLREANQDASAGSLQEVQRIVARLRQRWPKVKIILLGGGLNRRPRRASRGAAVASAGQCSVEVLDQVLGVFYAHAQPDKIPGDTARLPDKPGNARVRHCCRMRA
jgi:hypothetical protein